MHPMHMNVPVHLDFVSYADTTNSVRIASMHGLARTATPLIFSDPPRLPLDANELARFRFQCATHSTWAAMR